MSNTPITDAFQAQFSLDEPQAYQAFNFARQLERELNQWKQMADELADCVDILVISSEYTVPRAEEAIDAYNKLKGTT